MEDVHKTINSPFDIYNRFLTVLMERKYPQNDQKITYFCQIKNWSTLGEGGARQGAKWAGCIVGNGDGRHTVTTVRWRIDQWHHTVSH